MDDGTFSMSRSDADSRVDGSYSLDANAITLFDVSGDTGRTAFPVTCTVEPTENGFRLSGDVHGCAVLIGLEFERAGG